MGHDRKPSPGSNPNPQQLALNWEPKPPRNWRPWALLVLKLAPAWIRLLAWLAERD